MDGVGDVILMKANRYEEEPDVILVSREYLPTLIDIMYECAGRLPPSDYGMPEERPGDGTLEPPAPDKRHPSTNAERQRRYRERKRRR